MTGECNGNAVFITGVNSKHLQSTFLQLTAKLQQQFPQTEISLQTDSHIVQADNQTPERRQHQRLI